MKRVILTGATGFVGRQAIEPLVQQGFEVHAITRGATEQRQGAENVVWHSLDLLDAAKVGDFCRVVRAGYLLHFAWYVEHGKFWNAPENLDWVAASLNLLRRFAENGGRRVVSAGTVAEYDWRTDGVYSETETSLAQHTLYGASKHAVHLILRRFAEQTNLEYAWGRIFFLFGAGEAPNRLVASVVRSLLNDEPAKCSHGNQIRDFMAVEDAADAFAALLASDVCGAVNVASGKAVKLKDLIYVIADSLGARENVRLGAIPPQTGEPTEIVADTRRLREEVGWQPQRTLDERLSQTIDWWRMRN